MSAPSPLFVLGAPDAEMTAIETLLRECGQRIAYAIGRSGQRVVPGQTGVGVQCEDGQRFDSLSEDWANAQLSLGEMIAIEVAGPWGQPAIDHHDGAERASWGPDRFLQASSLGQVVERLAIMGVLPAAWREDVIGGHLPAGQIDSDGQGYLVWGGLTGAHADGGGLGEFAIERMWHIPKDLVYEAAADHCPAAAVAGLCPGVDPGAFAPFLAESKRQQYFPAMSAEDFARELEISRATLLAAPPVTEFCDPHPAGFSPDLPPEVYLVGATPDDCPLGSWVPPQEAEDDGDGDMGLISSEWLYICRHEPDGTPVGVPATAGMLAMRDLRHLEPGTVPAVGSGECYPSTFLVGIVAALFEGVGFVCRIRRRDGRLALRSNGHGQGTAAGTLPAEVFLADPSAFGCGPTQPPGQDASYGNPVRGFFGGTLIDQG